MELSFPLLAVMDEDIVEDMADQIEMDLSLDLRVARWCLLQAAALTWSH
jgi:hypothetical protein